MRIGSNLFMWVLLSHSSPQGLLPTHTHRLTCLAWYWLVWSSRRCCWSTPAQVGALHASVTVTLCPVAARGGREHEGRAAHAFLWLQAASTLLWLLYRRQHALC